MPGEHDDLPRELAERTGEHRERPGQQLERWVERAQLSMPLDELAR